ncbi:outer membrane receptor protein involved in Fe transport [Neolewinella xylanilytica]|uniref:Outer membrane receptor protein involved in Fe transport n=1 Tax=Neolewinella xylanilytica TaxID=1514080 RepID=A0A2S6I878_9BACT|nr:outer membrane receptor protein involved in Fe transport [Neolewinella xylanilytica]
MLSGSGPRSYLAVETGRLGKPALRLAATLLFLVGFISTLGAQDRVTLSGYVRDASDGETLIGATVQLDGTTLGTVTNAYGFYSLTVAPGSYTVRASYLGYAERKVVLELNGNLTRDFALEEAGSVLQEVVVTAVDEDENVSNLQMSVERLDMSTIEKLPSLLGEVDVIRSIQLLPGVTTVGEGAAGFNVRGGSIDQNLVILDEAPVFNSSHLFGFFSVFNPDAVKGVQLYKGGIPARYGGRLSSILDVRMKEGNNQQFEMQGGIGTIFSRLSVEAPLVKDKSSFLLAGRRSYIDVLAAPFLNDNLSGTRLNFYDLTLKTNYRFSDKDQVFLSGYLGRDVFSPGDAAGFSWGNATGTLRWNHLFSDKLFANLTVYYSDYDYAIDFGDDPDEDAFNWDASIVNTSVKPEFSYFVSPDNVIRFGGQAIYYRFEPANAIAVSGGDEIDISLSRQWALESSAFVENEVTLWDRLKLNYGLRLSHFAYLGGRNIYEFGEAPREGLPRPLTGVTPTERNEVIDDWLNLEPRAAAQFTLNSTSSVKASYQRTVQYIHLLSNTTASIPLDIWTPSTNNIQPQRADQFALGYFRNLSDNTYELSLETYYKDFANLVDYIDGADLILNELVEGQVLSGEGRAYGAEVQLKKNKGRASGWLSYTLARSERLVPGINNDDWYPTRFDQTHNFNLTAFYELSDRVSLSGTFVYNTGTPTTLPNSGYYQLGYYIPNNAGDARNNFRIPDYHRLDVSLTLDPKKEKADRRWQGQWIFGIYNLYARRNPFTIYADQLDGRTLPGQAINTEAIKLSVVGSIIPSVSYNFTFQ